MSTPDVYEIVDYNSGWPDEADALIAEIRQRAGPAALSVVHIGSTSVPGLAAKDVIDLQLTVRDLGDVDGFLDALAEHGWEYRADISGDHVPAGATGRPDDWSKRYLTRATPRKAHLHIRRFGAANHRYALLFRDYLRANEASAAAYARFKRDLLAAVSERAHYVEVKDAFCDMVIVAAEAWATATSWREPGTEQVPPAGNHRSGI